MKILKPLVNFKYLYWRFIMNKSKLWRAANEKNAARNVTKFIYASKSYWLKQAFYKSHL